MAQPQQQYPMPQRPYSPPKPATSVATQQPFGLPPNKRQRLSPNPTSQPGSPYVQSPYAMSPNTSASPSTGASPHFSTVQLPQGVYNTPYSNGQTSSVNLPQSLPPTNITPQYTSSLNFPNQNQFSQQTNFNYMLTSNGVGAMGPPSKPVDKGKEDGVDVMDVLGGTGIDLREEEQYTFQLYNSSFNSQVSGSQSGTISSGHSFTQFPPGDESSFYGAGPANAAPDAVGTKSQDEFHKKAADKAWHDAARNLAISRQRELSNPFLEVRKVHRKAEKIARENGLGLNVDAKGMMGTMRLPEDFDQSTVKVNTVIGPNGAFTTTSGTFIPSDTLLVDQLALLSIATKHRLRGLLEEASALAKGRQTGSHGIVPPEWADAAAPFDTTATSLVPEGAPRIGWESVFSPTSIPQKRSMSAASRFPTPVSERTKTPAANAVKFGNEVVTALRTTAVKERDYEEARLRKRMGRTSGDGTPRQGSMAPVTPGSVAPDPMEKATTRKEQKKKAEAKVNEAASHAAANVTTAQFLGGGGGLFGKKKKYSWMTGGGGGTASGTSTPGRITTQGLPGTPGAALGSASEKLTVDGARRLGTRREDKEKGKGIQIRDWITVLEDDGHEKRALQKAFTLLDTSEPK